MRKRIVILIVGAMFLGAGLGAIASAQAAKDMTGTEMMMKKSMKMEHKGEGMNKMGGMMMESMMKKNIIATSDGGVIVMAGNKLMKYDKDLNLIKEVDIKIDMEAIKKDMKAMMENCPMMQKESMEEEKMEHEMEKKAETAK
ncbi:MAG: hypothetical protein HQL25_05210 [Candidatus Omnitrophica bacterium]|nr:hypothetical protein [Candidatus Omnitrophota bacterium]